MIAKTFAVAAKASLKPLRRYTLIEIVRRRVRPSGRPLNNTRTNVTQQGAAVRPPADIYRNDRHAAKRGRQAAR